MKKVMLLLAVAGTVLIAAAGFILPETVFEMQDEKMQNETASYKMEQTGFRSASYLTESLKLVSQNYSQVELEKGKILDEESVWQLGQEFLQEVSQKGISFVDPARYEKHTVKPFLAIAADHLLTAVFWQCNVWNDSGETVTLILEDNSGAVVAISISPLQLNENAGFYEVEGMESSYIFLYNITRFFAEKLGIGEPHLSFASDIDSDADTAVSGAVGEYADTSSIEGYLILTDSEEEPVKLPVSLSEERFSVGYVNFHAGP